MKKEKQTTQQLLSSIRVSVSDFFRDRRAVSSDSWNTPSHTKKGPGRYHEQGVRRYVPRQQEFSEYRFW